VCAFEGIAHDGHETCAVVGEVNSPLLFAHQPVPGISIHGVEAISNSEVFLCNFKFVFVDIHSVNAGSAQKCGSLSDSQTDGSKTPDSDRASGSPVRVVHDSTPSSGDTTSDEADLVGIGLGVDLGQ